MTGISGHPALALVKSLAESVPVETGLPELEQAVDDRFAQIVEQAQDEGTVRRDIPPHEVIGLLNVAICRSGARADDP